MKLRKYVITDSHYLRPLEIIEATSKKVAQEYADKQYPRKRANLKTAQVVALKDYPEDRLIKHGLA